jgi:hypothetical protein
MYCIITPISIYLLHTRPTYLIIFFLIAQHCNKETENQLHHQIVRLKRSQSSTYILYISHYYFYYKYPFGINEVKM